MSTKLKNIIDHNLFIQCPCSHQQMVRVSALVIIAGEDETIAGLKGRLRCSNCRAKMVGRILIIYDGASSKAMEGAATKPNGPVADISTL